MASLDLDRIVTAAVERRTAGDGALCRSFASAFLSDADGNRAGSEAALASTTAAVFDLALRRTRDEVIVRVEGPPDRPGRSVVDVVQADRPFLVDTVRLVLGRAGLRERAFLPPVLLVRRDAQGALVGIGGEGATRESLIHVEVSPRIDDPARRVALETELAHAMRQVQEITDDFAKLVRATRELVAQVEFAGARLPDGAERARRVQGFLEWLIADHFVFVGLRRYRLRRLASGDCEVQLVAGQGLGLFRDDATSRLVEPIAGAAVPEELRDVLDDPRILVIGKSRIESPLHRPGRIDRIAVTEYDDRGTPCGLTLLFGLFTTRALRTPGSQVPLLRERLEQILRKSGAEPRSHRHRAIAGAFDSVPLEVLLGTDVEGVAALIHELVESEGRGRVRLVLRADRHGRALYAAVLMPRSRYGEALRARLRGHLERRTGATYVDDRVSFLEEGTAVLHYFCTSATGPLARPDAVALENELRDLSSGWSERFEAALVERFGETEGVVLADRYADAYPELLRVATHPIDAARGVEAVERLAATGEPHFALYFDHGDTLREAMTLDVFLPAPMLLSDLLPVIDGFGIRVIDAQQARITPQDRPDAVVASLRVLPFGATQADLDAVGPRLEAAIAAVLTGRVASDPLNGLVLGAGLEWREIDLVRAYLEYFLQIQGALTRPFVRNVLLENPLAARLLVKLHAVRFGPAPADADRTAQQQWLQRAFEGYRDRIPSLNEDRALSGIYALVMATLRTTFFAELPEPHRIAVKIDPALVPEIAPPRPWREIFVHGQDVMGIHLRGGPVARGGLRWSDRHDDLRVEVLGLMRTQQLKNGLIVPVGAKGGFVIKRGGLSPSEARREADAQYRVFVESLLALTDDLDAEGGVVPPAGVVRHDGDDPYLVVAADKGTAHLSDAANAIAIARGFWLGDAFASGGSEGYDHKKYAITARGAWECAKHHMAELGIDPERDAYTAIGIGDMSGDVFGNGALLMRRARLLAAFDHRHVFLDPEPDPEVAWNERRRLFEVPASSWADYDAAKISAGGGVFPRAAKQIDLAPAVRERLGLAPGRVSGQDLVRAMLSLDVDLLWNGGIGTYVRASTESNADVGDRANDGVRIDARALRARVVAEGGNLGFTQAARVEAALAGVRIETDSVDNSAGVDLSDHEVNYKIAIAPLVRSGRLDPASRHAALFGASADACESVLSHNRGQALALSLDERRSARDALAYRNAAQWLCEAADLDPAALGLPTEQAFAERVAQGRGYVRPEIAVLLGVSKLVVRRAVAASPLADASALEALYAGYFPSAFREAWPDALRAHRLRREITALALTNRLVDAGGAALVPSLVQELGVSVADAVAALFAAEEVLGIDTLRRALRGAASLPRDAMYAALLEVDRGTRAVARFLAKSGAASLDIDAIRVRSEGIARLRGHVAEFLSSVEADQAAARAAALEAGGVPSDLALEVAMLPLADRGLNVLRLCERTGVEPLEAARVYVRLGEGSGIHAVHRRLLDAVAATPWDRMVLADLRWDLLDLQGRATERVLAARPNDPIAAVNELLDRHEALLESVRQLEARVRATDGAPPLVVLASRLRTLLGD